MMSLWICIVAFFGVGLFFLLEEIFRYPTFSSRRCMTKLWNSRREKSFLNRQLDAWNKRLTRHIRLSVQTRESLAVSLTLSGETCTPEEFVVSCLLKGILLTLFLLPIGWVNAWFFLMAPILGMLFSFSLYRKVGAKAEERREVMEGELPGFVTYLSQRIHREPSVLRLVSGYREEAKEPFRSELETAAAAMSNGNEEAALLQLERRVHSPKMSMIVRGLLGVLRGENMDLFWQNLSAKMEEEHKQAVKKEASKFPKSIRKYSLLLLGCFLLTYLVVIGEEIMTSLGGMF